MREDAFDNVLLVCGRGEECSEILRNMFDHGISVIGPAETASIAMILASQSEPTIAVVARPPAGRRDTAQLADDLYRTWGVPTWVMPGVEDASGIEAAAWFASEDRIERLRKAVTGLDRSR